MNISSHRHFALRLIVLLLIFAFISVQAFVPDEGMYAPDQIASLPLKKRGLKIDPSKIYDPSAPSISDAIMRVNIGTGGFGTGEFVSPNGLILTNHHVGFDALVEASTPDNNLGERGFKADSMSEELPAKGYSVIITTKESNVTKQALAGTDALTGQARDAKIKANIDVIVADQKAKTPDSDVSVREIDEGFFYYLYVSYTIKDIRVVYAPPKDIGFYGGDPDNFEWTRHAGDFTFLRAYVAPDGSFAEYSPDNVPYNPKKFLTVSLQGIDEGDFVMVMGYPGGTSRFLESGTIEYAQDVNFPFIADYVRKRSEVLQQISKEHPEKAVALQDDIFSLNNAVKLYDGNVEAMRRAHIVEKRRKQEQELTKWIESDPGRRAKFGGLFNKIDALTSMFYRTASRDRALSIFPSSSTTRAFASAYAAMVAASREEGVPSEAEKENREKAISAAYKDWDPQFEKEMIVFFLEKIDALPRKQRFAELDNLLRDKRGKARLQAERDLASKIVTDFDSPENVFPIFEMTNAEIESKYPEISGLVFGLHEARTDIGKRTARFEAAIAPLRLEYREALTEWKKTVPYPDANATLRFSYGNVKGYSPREAVTYHPFTTLAGAIEKDTGKEPFDVPAKLEELYKKRDFGIYGKNGTMPVDFLSDTDIIGGNSGSPVLNGRGEQVGIVFDGNYEGLGNDMFFNPARGRTISVDIRYVLFVTDKFGGAGWILNEMKINKPKGLG